MFFKISKIKTALKLFVNFFTFTFKGNFDLWLYDIKIALRFKKVVRPLPDMLMIEPTNICNLRCPGCSTGSGRLNRAKKQLGFDDFKDILKQLEGYIDRVSLFFMGEPFINPELLKMVRYAKSKGIYTKTSTNGTLFKDKEFCREIVKSGFDYLIVSLDGADQKTLEKYRIGSDFKNVTNGIRNIVEAKKELNTETPIIEIQYILMKHNEHQRAEMRELANSLGADIFAEKGVAVDFDYPNLQELIPEKLEKSRFTIKNGEIQHIGEIKNDCNWIKHKMVISADGNVLACCNDQYSTNIMGNIYKDTIKNIWKNKKYTQFRKQIWKDRKKIKICTKCSEGRGNFKQIQEKNGSK